jgi:hypothetical protein
MRMNDFISPARFRLLLKKDFYTQYKTYFIGIGAICCILFIVNIASVASWNSWNFNLVFYPLTLFIGGFIFTSLSFGELASEQSRISYLTLPASVFEKFASRLLVTSAGYVLVSVAFYFVFSVIAFAVNMLIFGVAHPVFNPAHPVIVLCIGLYLVTQSVFFAGAVYFRGNALIKTIVALFVLALAFWIFMAIVFAGALYGIVAIRHIDFPFDLFFKGQYYPAVPHEFDRISTVFAVVIQVLFWFVLAPLAWVIGYFRLKEVEV